ncbi:hypothetical protein [Halospeciosus flavus]|uniref:Small CPxCG-related zinc finger protein n=1 Tax=Halospeciosus flavus TaxID=3032283 RepID=A0ABD5Z0G2_9EURY|nr:hypothetical protein [Halospeciosus flavus]
MSHSRDQCPVCGEALVPFAEVDDETRSSLEADQRRQRQSVPHRREKHSICPACTYEQHGCGQPYALPEDVVEN